MRSTIESPQLKIGDCLTAIYRLYVFNLVKFNAPKAYWLQNCVNEIRSLVQIAASDLLLEGELLLCQKLVVELVDLGRHLFN
jgi:hypothetical protein